MNRFLVHLRSPVGLVLASFVLGLVLMLIATRLQVAAYWETHPVQYQESLQLSVMLKQQADARRMKDPSVSAAIDKLLDQRIR